MTETVVVELFLTLRVFLVGGILLILPRITRKGLLFGVYVGEEVVEGEAALGIRRSWSRGCGLLMALSLAVGWGIGLAGWPVTGNFTGTGVLLLTGLGHNLRMHRRARGLAPPEGARCAEQAAAPLQGGEPRGAGFAKLTLAICVLLSLAAVGHAIVGYEGMPERVPSLRGAIRPTGALVERSPIPFLFFPSLNLVISPFFALLALLVARAKRSVRGGSGGRSIEAQDAFRATMAYVFSGSALFICALLTLLSVQFIRVGLSQTRSLGHGIWWLMGAMLLFMFGSLIRIMKGHGQGGALRESGSADAPLTDGLADNTHWIWGLFYVDRDDPSIMVEVRFGIGYTLNYGNRTAVLIVVVFSLLLIGVAAMAAIWAAS